MLGHNQWQNFIENMQAAAGGSVCVCVRMSVCLLLVSELYLMSAPRQLAAGCCSSCPSTCRNVM